jgi:hypothetical protein
MSVWSEKLKAGAMAVTAAFSLNALLPASAEAQSPMQASTATDVPHPLFQPGLRSKYSSSLSLTLVAATKDNKASLYAAGFSKALEERLAGPALARAQTLTEPNKEITPNMLVITGVIPPAAMFSNTPISVCAERSGKVVGTYLIHPNGDVKEDKQRAPNGTGPADTFQFACKPHALAYAKEIRDALNADATPPGAPAK